MKRKNRIDKLKTAVIEINGYIGKNDDGDRGAEYVSNGMDYERFKIILEEKLDGKNYDQLRIDIRSGGGDVEQAILIYEELCSMKDIRIITHCRGNVASAATIIAQAGHNRIISNNSLYLIHEAMVKAEGNKYIMNKMGKVLATMDRKIARIYAQRSGKIVDLFEIIMAKDSGRGEWMDAQMVLDIGLVDEIATESRWDRIKTAIKNTFEPMTREITIGANNIDAKKIIDMLSCNQLEYGKENHLRMNNDGVDDANLNHEYQVDLIDNICENGLNSDRRMDDLGEHMDANSINNDELGGNIGEPMDVNNMNNSKSKNNTDKSKTINDNYDDIDRSKFNHNAYSELNVNDHNEYVKTDKNFKSEVENNYLQLNTHTTEMVDKYKCFNKSMSKDDGNQSKKNRVIVQKDCGPSRTKDMDDPMMDDMKISGNRLAYQQDVEMFRN